MAHIGYTPSQYFHPTHPNKKKEKLITQSEIKGFVSKLEVRIPRFWFNWLLGNLSQAYDLERKRTNYDILARDRAIMWLVYLTTMHWFRRL